MKSDLQSNSLPPLTGRADRYFEEHNPHTGLGRAAERRGAMLVAARPPNVVQVAAMVLLARLLNPRGFGLVAMVTALVAFAPTLIDLGTADASLQKARITRGEISALFWLNVAVGEVLTDLPAGAGGIIASIFGEPALTSIAPASSLSFIMTAGSIQHYALVRRAMDFGRLSMIDTAANVISSVVAVAMALVSWGYWALVAKPVLALTAVGALISRPWLPGRPRVTPDVQAMVRFGLGVTGFTVTDNLARSADRLAIGYFFGAGPLGYFQNAFLVYRSALSALTEPLHNVAVSGLSKLRSAPDELRRSCATALSALSFVVAGAFAGLESAGRTS